MHIYILITHQEEPLEMTIRNLLSECSFPSTSKCPGKPVSGSTTLPPPGETPSWWRCRGTLKAGGASAAVNQKAAQSQQDTGVGPPDEICEPAACVRATHSGKIIIL